MGTDGYREGNDRFPKGSDNPSDFPLRQEVQKWKDFLNELGWSDEIFATESALSVQDRQATPIEQTTRI
jgi:hypothetical protein